METIEEQDSEYLTSTSDALIIVPKDTMTIQEELIKKLKSDIKKLNINLLYLKETNIKKKLSLFENINNYY
mgnify:CR=1 FL=1